MRRRGFLKGLLGGIVAGPAALQAIAAKAAPVATASASEAVVQAALAAKHSGAALVDIRAILTANMLRDIQTEEDRLFIERMRSAIEHHHYEPS